MPPEQATVSILRAQEPQDEVFIVGRSYVVKKARSYEEMDTMPSSSQSPSRKRIRSDSDTWEDEMAELYAQSLESRKGSSFSPVNRLQVAEEMKERKEKYHECSVPIAYTSFRAMHRQGEPQEYRHRKDYADERWSRTSFKETREWYLGLKPKGKKGQIDTELRLVQLNRQYNDYSQEHDDNFILAQLYNEERSVEFNRRACNTHTEKRLWWGGVDGFERKLLFLDTRQWVKGDVEGPEQYPEGLEKKFRDLRMFALDDLFKEVPEPEAPWDQLVKNGKY